MIKKRPILLLAATLLIITLVVPTLLVVPFTGEQKNPNVTKAQSSAKQMLNQEPAVEVAVYRSKQSKVEKLPLEEYVAGVVASEMPAEFEVEALKAQALTARTYIVKQLMSKQKLNSPDGSVVTDTVMHQVYKSPEELQTLWGIDYEWKMARIKQAVSDTRGEIITYKGNPITASFFSTSNGFTENSEDYWSEPIPYLRSVASPWDKKSPKYLSQKSFSIPELERRLNVTITGNGLGEIVSRTKGNRVDQVKIAGKTFAGRDIREKLELKSSDFTWKKNGNTVVFTTKGYGHGVGMSQYGALGMAEDGKTVNDIISYYYKGTKVSSVAPFVATLTAKK